MGCTNLAKHKIKVTDDEPFIERFWKIPPPMADKVCIHVKEKLEAGMIHPSQSPVVLVCKEEGGLHFYLNLHKLDARTKKDSYPLPQIQEVI